MPASAYNHVDDWLDWGRFASWACYFLCCVAAEERGIYIYIRRTSSFGKRSLGLGIPHLSGFYLVFLLHTTTIGKLSTERAYRILYTIAHCRYIFQTSRISLLIYTSIHLPSTTKCILHQPSSSSRPLSSVLFHSSQPHLCLATTYVSFNLPTLCLLHVSQSFVL